MEGIRLLWQCGRSVTLTCSTSTDPALLLQRSLQASEDYQSAAELTDTWAHWATKVNALLSTLPSKKPAEQEKFLKAKDISFKGAPSSRALVNAVAAMKRYSAQSLHVLTKIDKKYSIFSDGYTKLTRLSQIAASLPQDVSQLPTKANDSQFPALSDKIL